MRVSRGQTLWADWATGEVQGVISVSSARQNSASPVPQEDFRCRVDVLDDLSQKDWGDVPSRMIGNRSAAAI